MAEEEDGHRDALIELHRKRFGERIPLIRREHVRGYLRAQAGLAGAPARRSSKVRARPKQMEEQAYRFYVEAAKRTTDASTRKLLGDLAAAEQGARNRWRMRLGHKHLAERRARTRKPRPSGASSS